MSLAIEARRREAQAARARLSSTVAAIRYRTNPKTIAHEAVESAKEAGTRLAGNAKEAGTRLAENSVETVRTYPQASAAAAAAATAFLFRRPLGRLLSMVFRRRRPTPKPAPRTTVPLAVVQSLQEDSTL